MKLLFYLIKYIVKYFALYTYLEQTVRTPEERTLLFFAVFSLHESLTFVPLYYELRRVRDII